MANQILEIFAGTGETTLTISIAPYGSTAYTESAIALTEVVGLPGTYRGTSIGGGTGLHYGIDSNGRRWHFLLANVADSYYGHDQPLSSNLLNTTGVRTANVTQWLGTAPSTPTVAGVPNVNAKTWNDLTTVALPLVPTTAGRTLDVSATGEAGVDWANVGSPTTTLVLSGTTVKAVTDRVTANSDQINGSATAASTIAAMNSAFKTGTVDTATFAATTTVFETSRTDNSDEYTAQALLWTNGANAGLTSRISSYVFSANLKDKLTLAAATPNTPANGDTFYVLGRIE